MIVAQISDTHIALDTDDAEKRIDDFARTIADINALDTAPDVIVHTGDVVHNGLTEEYERAAAILARASAPAYVLAGNKDDRGNLRAAFAGQGYLAADAAYIQYAVEGFPVRLVMVDTVSTLSNKGDFCQDRERHLGALLAEDASRPIAVFAHHPPYPVHEAPEALHYLSEEPEARLRGVLSRSANVAAIFCGHVHRTSAGAVGTIPASAMPAIATTLRKGDYPDAMKSRPVYQLHHFDPRWGLTSQTRIVP